MPLLLAAAAHAADFSAPKLPRLPATPVLQAAGPSLPSGLGPGGLPGAPAAPPAAFSLDRTEDLKAVQRAVRAGEAGPLPAQAAQVRYLFVPGHSWRALPGYWAPALERLRALGLDARRVDTGAFGRVADNARLIRREIESEDTPVVVIGHSRGGLEALEALRQDPKLGARVKAVVAVQTPWAGTPAALLAPRSLLPASRELSEDHRREKADRAPEMPEGASLWSVATSLGLRTWARPAAALAARLLRLWTRRAGDGVVPTDAAVIPGSIYAVLEHVSHWDTVAGPAMLKLLGLGAREHDPRFAADFAEALVRWVLSSPATGTRPGTAPKRRTT